MYNRYRKNNIVINNSPSYKQVLDDKNIKLIRQLTTFDFSKLNDPEIENLQKTIHIVESNERLYQISNLYYDSPEYGWLICYTNKLSSELQIYPGMALTIYYPLADLMRFL